MFELKDVADLKSHPPMESLDSLSKSIRGLRATQSTASVWRHPTSPLPIIQQLNSENNEDNSLSLANNSPNDRTRTSSSHHLEQHVVQAMFQDAPVLSNRFKQPHRVDFSGGEDEQYQQTNNAQQIQFQPAYQNNQTFKASAHQTALVRYDPHLYFPNMNNCQVSQNNTSNTPFMAYNLPTDSSQAAVDAHKQSEVIYNQSSSSFQLQLLSASRKIFNRLISKSEKIDTNESMRHNTQDSQIRNSYSERIANQSSPDSSDTELKSTGYLRTLMDSVLNYSLKVIQPLFRTSSEIAEQDIQPQGFQSGQSYYSIQPQSIETYNYQSEPSQLPQTVQNKQNNNSLQQEISYLCQQSQSISIPQIIVSPQQQPSKETGEVKQNRLNQMVNDYHLNQVYQNKQQMNNNSNQFSLNSNQVCSKQQLINQKQKQHRQNQNLVSQSRNLINQNDSNLNQVIQNQNNSNITTIEIQNEPHQFVNCDSNSINSVNRNQEQRKSSVQLPFITINEGQMHNPECSSIEKGETKTIADQNQQGESETVSNTSQQSSENMKDNLTIQRILQLCHLYFEKPNSPEILAKFESQIDEHLPLTLIPQPRSPIGQYLLQSGLFLATFGECLFSKKPHQLIAQALSVAMRHNLVTGAGLFDQWLMQRMKKETLKAKQQIVTKQAKALRIKRSVNTDLTFLPDEDLEELLTRHRNKDHFVQEQAPISRNITETGSNTHTAWSFEVSTQVTPVKMREQSSSYESIIYKDQASSPLERHRQTVSTETQALITLNQYSQTDPNLQITVAVNTDDSETQTVVVAYREEDKNEATLDAESGMKLSMVSVISISEGEFKAEIFSQTKESRQKSKKPSSTKSKSKDSRAKSRLRKSQRIADIKERELLPQLDIAIHGDLGSKSQKKSTKRYE